MKKKITEEEIRENNIKRVKNEHPFCPEPTRFFRVGEYVRLGAWGSSRVAEVIEDGKYYRIIDENTDRDSWFPWYSIHSAPVSNKVMAKNKDIRNTYLQQSVEGLLGKVLSFGVDFDPDYQRDFVWNDKDREKLIDSIFNNIQIGNFVFVELPWRGREYPAYQILDGKQRLSAIVDFYLNKFKYQGYYFNDLIREDQNWFKHFPVSVAELPENTPREKVLRQFILLNTTGHVVGEEQLEKVRKLLEKEEQK